MKMVIIDTIISLLSMLTIEFILIDNCTVITNDWKMAKNCSNNIFADKAKNRGPFSAEMEGTFNVIYSLEESTNI